MLIRVKERGLNKKNRKNKRDTENDRERGKRRENKALRNYLLDHESSVEVGYGFMLFVVNS